MVEVCIVYDKVRFEEKSLYKKVLDKGHKLNFVDGKTMVFNTKSEKKDYPLGDIILQRQVSYYRGLYVTLCLEHLRFNVINSFTVSEICGNKLSTSLLLSKNNIPTPRTSFAFSSESAMNEMTDFGFPLVIKPIIGSWGRGIYQIKDKDMARMLIENREEYETMLSRIYYIQEYIERPPRDIRCIVVGNKIIASVFRYSAQEQWKTNVAMGGKTEEISLNRELEDITLKAANCVGEGILGIDLMEDREKGYVVHEINNTVEFRGASSVCRTDIAGSIVDYLVDISRR